MDFIVLWYYQHMFVYYYFGNHISVWQLFAYLKFCIKYFKDIVTSYEPNKDDLSL